MYDLAKSTLFLVHFTLFYSVSQIHSTLLCIIYCVLKLILVLTVMLKLNLKIHKYS